MQSRHMQRFHPSPCACPLSTVWFDSLFRFSPKPLAFRHYFLFHVCASLVYIQVAGLLGFSQAALVRQVQLCKLIYWQIPRIQWDWPGAWYDYNAAAGHKPVLNWAWKGYQAELEEAQLTCKCHPVPTCDTLVFCVKCHAWHAPIGRVHTAH